MGRPHRLVTTLAFTLTLVIGASADAGNKNGPRGSFRAQQRLALDMAKRLRGYGLPRQMVVAPLKMVRTGSKIGTLPGFTHATSGSRTKGIIGVTAQRGAVTLRQSVSNTAANRSIESRLVMRGSTQASGQSINIRQDAVLHTIWKTKADRTKVTVNRMAYPAAGGDVIVRSTTTVAKPDGTTSNTTKYFGVTHVGKLGEVHYKLDEAQFKARQLRVPFVFPGSN